MPTVTLQNEAKLLLQNRFAAIAKKVNLTGNQTESGTVGPLVLPNQGISWQAASASLGLRMSGTESFNIGCSATVTPRNVIGVALYTIDGELLLSDTFAQAQQATYTQASDGDSGKYTISTLTINFS